MRPYRCRECKARFWRFRPRINTIILYLFMVITFVASVALMWYWLERVASPNN